MIKTAHSIIYRPLFTEKTTAIREASSESMGEKVVFEVSVDANKIEIRKAVEELFGVHVVDVNTMVQRGKRKRVGRFLGRKPRCKKAVVTLKQGEMLELFGDVGA